MLDVDTTRKVVRQSQYEVTIMGHKVTIVLIKVAIVRKNCSSQLQKI